MCFLDIAIYEFELSTVGFDNVAKLFATSKRVSTELHVKIIDSSYFAVCLFFENYLGSKSSWNSTRFMA